MTFIYRQLLGVADEFSPLVMTANVCNQNRFPYERVECRPKSAIEYVYSTAIRRLYGRYLPMWSSRHAFWRQVLQENDIRLIHAHFGYSGLEVLPLARSMRMPLLVTFHGADASKMLESRHYVRDLQSLFEYASIITVSETMAQRLEGIGARRDRMFVHYIGAPVEDFSFVQRKPVAEKVSDGERITLLQVANFVEKKGHRYTIDAFSGLLQRYPNCQLVLAGDGALRSDCEKQVSELGIAEKVDFVGSVAKDQVISLMGEADVFLHHSVTASNGSQEGLPTVLMEAMATGLPVVTTWHAGIPELVQDADNGYLVAERDVESYVDRLEKVLECPREMPDNASRTVLERFNLNVQNRKLRSIYSRVIEQSPR